jgi:hypothetical protein
MTVASMTCYQCPPLLWIAPFLHWFAPHGYMATLPDKPVQSAQQQYASIVLWEIFFGKNQTAFVWR